MHRKPPVTQPQTLRQRFVAKKSSTQKLAGSGYHEYASTDQVSTLTEVEKSSFKIYFHQIYKFQIKEMLRT